MLIMIKTNKKYPVTNYNRVMEKAVTKFETSIQCSRGALESQLVKVDNEGMIGVVEFTWKIFEGYRAGIPNLFYLTAHTKK